MQSSAQRQLFILYHLYFIQYAAHITKQRYKMELHDIFVVEVFSFCIQLKCFCSNLWNRARPTSVPVALHHTIGTRYFVALGMIESSEAGPQSYVKRNLMALLIYTKKVMCIISELKIVSLWPNIKAAYWRCVFNVHKPGLYSILLTNCEFKKMN